MRLTLILSSLLLFSAAFPAIHANGEGEDPEVAHSEVPTTDPHPESDRWVEATLNITQPDFTTMQIQAALTLRKHKVDGTEYSSADDISDVYRQLVDADSVARDHGQESTRADKFVRNMERSTTDAMADMLERAFPGANVTVESATLDRATLAAPDDKPFAPGIGLVLTANVVRTPESIGLGNSDADDLDALFDAGAQVTTSVTLSSQSGYDLTYVLTPTPGTMFVDADGGVLTAGGKQVTVEVPYGMASVPVTLSLRGADAPVYNAGDAKIGITVDLKDLEVSIGQAAGGDFGKLLVDLSVDANLGVIEVPESLAAGVPAKVKFDYLSSDAIRLLVQRGKITDVDLAGMEASLLKKVGDQLGGALGGPVTVTGGFDRTSFAASHIATPLSGDKPLVFHASASIVKPLSGGPIEPAAAIALYSTSLPLSLPKVQGLDTTYTVILPRGLAVTGLDATGGTYESGKSADGRDQFTVTPTDERAEVMATMSVTPTFVMAKFWPVVLLAVILLVLIVGTPIALVMRRRKGKSS